MGEAIYYLRASFPEPVSDEKFADIKSLLLEISAAEDWWQGHRDMGHKGQRAEFWVQFKELFPLTTAMMLTSFKPLVEGDCSNDLSGTISYGDNGEWGNDIDNLGVLGNVLTYHAEVWHFSDWDLFADYLVSNFGADAVRWMSDEYDDVASALVG